MEAAALFNAQAPTRRPAWNSRKARRRRKSRCAWSARSGRSQRDNWTQRPTGHRWTTWTSGASRPAWNSWAARNKRQSWPQGPARFQGKAGKKKGLQVRPVVWLGALLPHLRWWLEASRAEGQSAAHRWWEKLSRTGLRAWGLRRSGSAGVPRWQRHPYELQHGPRSATSTQGRQ